MLFDGRHLRINKLASSRREIALSLEQLRWMDHDYSIKMVVAAF